MKKILLSSGVVIAGVVPVATVIACGDSTPEKVDTTLTFTVEDNLLSTARTGKQDIRSVNITNVLDGQSNIENIKTLSSKANSKIKLDITFNDAKLGVDVQIKDANTNKVVVTVNKVYVEPKKGTIELNAAGTNIAQFKKHVKTLVENFVTVSKVQGLTNEEIKRSLFDKYGASVGIEYKFFAKNTHHDALWQGTWSAQEAYDRATFMIKPNTEMVNKILDVVSPSLTFANVADKTDIVEAKLREFVLSLDGDKDFDAFAKAEKAINPSQSQITFGTFTSLSGTSDDMFLLSINTLTTTQINQFLVRAMNSSIMKGITDKTALKIWNLIANYAVAK